LTVSLIALSPKRALRGLAIGQLGGADQLERRAHLGIGGAPSELGGEGPEMSAISLVKGIDPETVLLDVMGAAKADPEVSAA
jgi:hypothetical protein